MSAPTATPRTRAATTRLLTGRSNATPERIALDHARDAFGLSADDIASLKLVARSVSPDGITHLRYNQVLSGIESYDSGLDAHVTRDGRLINSSSTVERGARLPDSSPAVSALAGLGEARDSRTGSPSRRASSRAAGPRPSPPARRPSCAGSPPARPCASRGTSTSRARLSYSVLVDAESGDTLVRKDLTEQLGGARYFPRDPDTSPADADHDAALLVRPEQRRHAAVGPVLAHLHRPRRPGPGPGLGGGRHARPDPGEQPGQP